MFNIGGAEVLVIALVALVVVGPEQLPSVLRKAGQYASKARTMSNGLRQEFMAGVNELDPNNWDDSSSKASDAPKGTVENPIVPRGYAERVKAGDAANPFKPVSKPMADPTPEEAAAEAEAEALKAQRRAEAARERADMLRAEAEDRAAKEDSAAKADSAAEADNPSEAGSTAAAESTGGGESRETAAQRSAPNNHVDVESNGGPPEPVEPRNSIADANSSKALES